jgi:hypothetical protein
MHEYFDIEEYNRFLVVQAQAALFILTYHGYLGVQSLWQTVAAFIAAAWVMNEIVNVTSMIAGVMGIGLGVIVVYTMNIKHDKVYYHQVFYFLIQPAIFYYTMRLYVEQRMYPVGIPLTFLVWLAINMAIWAFAPRTYSYYAALGVPVCSVFFFTWLIDKTAWVSISIATGVGLLYVFVEMMRKRTEKINRKK